MTTTTTPQGPALWATKLSDEQRSTLESLTEEANHLEALVRAFAIRAFDALQPYMEARALPESDEEDAFYEWSGADPLLHALWRISDHAKAAGLVGPEGNCDWFNTEAFFETERRLSLEKRGLVDPGEGAAR